MRVKLQWRQMFLKLKKKNVKDQGKHINMGVIRIVEGEVGVGFEFHTHF